MSEMVEHVDESGRVIEVVTRAEMRAGHLRHRAVFIAVLSPEGRLLAHRRSDLKDIWPGRWDIAAGGVAGVGESWLDAARRELAEELGVEAPLDDRGGGAYDDDDAHVVGRVFVAEHPGPFHFADGEVTETRFVTPAELASLRREHPFCPDSIELVGPLLGDEWSAAIAG